MKSNWTIGFLLLVAIVLWSCSSATQTNETKTDENSNTSIAKLNWLLGNWKNISADGNLYEKWQKVNDTLYTGIGLFISNGDTTFHESIVLKQEGPDLFYIPSVKNQNQNMPVRFKLTSSANGQFLFENPEHDFPQKIMYMQKSADTLYAETSGMVNGELKTEKFEMVKASK